MATKDFNALIDQAVNPNGGQPLIEGPALNSLLKNLTAELQGSDPSVEADLSSGSPTNVPSVLAVRTALALTASDRRLADAITSDYGRTFYDDAQSALDGAGDHGTANVYSLAYGAIQADDPTTTVPGLLFPNNVLITNLQGLNLYTPDANTDVLTFTGGTQIVNANHSAIITHPVLHNVGLGWTVTAHSNVVQDVTVNDLNILVQGIATHAIYLQDPGRYRFSGNITMGRVANSTTDYNYYRWGIYNRRGVFEGKGNLVGYGTDATTTGNGIHSVTQLLFTVSRGASTTWEGNISVYDDSAIDVNGNATLTLREGVLNAQQRTMGAGPLFYSGQGTIVLENYSVLCRPDEEAIRADIIILRGNSVVVGKINTQNLIDERPALPVPLKLEFAFGVGYADSYTTTTTGSQASHYTIQNASNVVQASYSLNGAAVVLPFSLVAGDTLIASITRADAGKGAVLSLQSF